MANRNNKQDIKRLKKEGFDLNYGPTNLAGLFQHLGSRQDVYLFINEANNYVESSYGLSVSAFYQDVVPPCLPPKFASYPTQYLSGYQGILVCTNINSVIKASQAVRAKKLFYIFDLEWLHVENRYKEEDIFRLLQDPTVVNFTRCVNYKNYLVDKGVDVHPKIVEDFNFADILEIANEG